MRKRVARAGRWKKIGVGVLVAASVMLALAIMLMDEKDKAVLQMIVAGMIERLSSFPGN